MNSGILVWAMIIFFAGGTDGGRSIDTQLRFLTEKDCEDAAIVVNKLQTAAKSSIYMSNQLFAVCVGKTVKGAS